MGNRLVPIVLGVLFCFRIAVSQAGFVGPLPGTTIELSEDFPYGQPTSPFWFATDFLSGPRWDSQVGQFIDTSGFVPPTNYAIYTCTNFKSNSMPTSSQVNKYYPCLFSGYGGTQNPFPFTTSGTSWMQIGFTYTYAFGGGVGIDALYDTDTSWFPTVGSTKKMHNGTSNPDCFWVLADGTDYGFTIWAGGQSYDYVEEPGSGSVILGFPHVVTISFKKINGQFSYNAWLDGNQVITNATFAYAPTVFWLGNPGSWNGAYYDFYAADFVRTWWSSN